MKIEVKKELDWLVEGYHLLKTYANGETICQILKNIEEKYKIESAIWEKQKRLFQAIDREAAQKFDSRKEIIEYYFGNLENYEGCLGDFIFYKSGFQPNETMEMLRTKVDGLTPEEKNKTFDEKINSFGQIDVDSNDSSQGDSMAILRHINKMDWNIAEKWKVQELYLDKEEHCERLNGLVEEAVELLQKKKKEMAPVLDEFAAYWSKFLEEQDIAKYLKKNISIDISDDFRGGEIRPSIVKPNTMVLARDGREGAVDEKFYFSIGVLFGETLALSTLNQKVEDKQSILQTLKVISDKSKFDILLLVGNKWVYGSQIAKHMNLTTATISHHMSALLENRLVELKKVENKIYYRQNRKRVEDVLDYCRSALLFQEQKDL